MFDNIINAAKDYFPGRFLLFVVAAIVLHALYQVIMPTGEPFNFMMLVQFTVSIAVAGLLASMVAGAASD